MATPFVTICTPVYNLEEYVAETLASIAAQTFTDFEVLIIDDGSTDGSAKAIEPFLSDARFRYIYQDNAGVGAARNKAIQMARGEWFAQMDGDDVYLPHAIQTFVELAQSDSRSNFVYANMVMFREDGHEQVAFQEDDFQEGDLVRLLYSKPGFSTQHVMLKTDDLRDIGGYSNDFPALEDYDMYLKFAHHGVWAKSRNEIVARYRVRAQSKTSGMIRNCKIAADMVNAAIDRETRPELIRVLKTTLAGHMSRFHLYSAIEAELNGNSDVEQHLWKSFTYRKKRQRRVLIAALLCTASRITHLSLGRNSVRKLILGAHNVPWSAYSN